MSVIERQEQLNGRWFCWVLLPNGNALILESDTEFTEEEAQAKLDEEIANMIEVSNEPTI